MGRKPLVFRVVLLLFFAGLLLLGYLAERVNNERYLTQVRSETQREMSRIGERLNANLYADLQLVRGLNSVINLIPDLDQNQFDAAVRPLFKGRTQLRNIAAAPDMVIQLMHPMAGNEKAIGLDYRKTPAQFAAARLARETRDVVLAGPLNLVQGGTGLIARMPIFVPDGQGGERFWGLVSAVIDSDRLFLGSGLLDEDSPIELALRGRDGSGAAGAVFLGRPELFNEKPDFLEISLPQGSWVLAAAPQQGWPTQADNAWTVRLLFGAFALVMLAALGGLARAMALADAAQNRAEAANQRLLTLIEQSPDAMVIVNRQGRIEMVNQQTEHLFGWARSELLGQSADLLIPESARSNYAVTQAHYFDSIDGPGPASIRRPVEARGLHKDGSLIDIEISLRPQSTERGTLVISIVRDISARKEAEARALASEQRVRVIADHLPVLISQLDRQQRYVFANASFGRLFNLDHNALIGHSLQESRGDAYYAQVKAQVEAALEGRSDTFETRLVIDGQERIFTQTYVPDIDSDGKVNGVHSVSTDITEHKHSEMRLARGERRLRMITDNIPALITHIDTQHHITFANAAWLDFYQVRPQDMIGKHIRDAMGEGFYEKRKKYVDEALTSGRRVEYEAVIATPEPVRHLHVVLIPDVDDHDQVVGLYTLGLDVTAQKASEALLEMQARVDHLTGLPNRRSFEEKIEEAAARAHRSGDALAVMYVDVDHFKQVNDRHGHDAGDAVLQKIAGRLRASVRGTDTVARLGGDEFVVLLESLRTEQEASAVARKILTTVREPIPLAAGSVTVSVSIGVALLSGAERTLSTTDLLKQADGALYEAKRAGRDSVFVSDFTPVG